MIALGTVTRSEFSSYTELFVLPTAEPGVLTDEEVLVCVCVDVEIEIDIDVGKCITQ